MKAPDNLKHKPIISVDNYDQIDGIYAGNSDAKALSIDDSNVLIGSFNLDEYSWWGNNEIMLDVLNSNKMVTDFDSAFDRLKNLSS